MQASPGEHQVYVWHPPGARLCVEIRLDLVTRIADWTRAGLQTEGRGIENGGILVGRMRRERGLTVVEVSDADLVECEHAAGPSFMLSNDDRRDLESKLRRRKGSVVGLFRSNTRREFSATMEDLALLSSHFPETWQVMLLVDATRGGDLRAGFIFREGREVRAAMPYLTFPFAEEWLPTMTARPSLVAVPSRAPEPAQPPAERHKPAASVPATAAAKLPRNWLAAAAVLIGVVVGVWYEGSRPASANKQTVTAEVHEAPKPVQPQPQPAEEQPAPSAAEPPAPTEESAPAPSLPVVPPPPALVSADRTAPPDPTPAPAPRREFVAPVVKRPAPAVADAELPSLSAPTSAAPLLAAGAGTPKAPVPTPVLPTVSRSAAESRVRVTVDAVPLHGRRFVPPETIKPATPKNVQVERPVVINVRVYLDRSGAVHYAELLSDGTGANRDLASAAVFSARSWKFAPATVDGKAVPAQAVLRFRFEPETR